MILFPEKHKTKPVIQRGCILKNIGSKGMTLLEMLVALGLFAFMFAFIAQIVRQNHREVRKISQDVQWRSTLSNTLDLMRSDFRGVAYFLDVNENLRVYFSKVQDQKDSSSSDTPIRADSQSRSQRSDYPVNLSPYFVFKGKDDELQFTSHSFSNLKVGDFSPQWIQIRYFVESCDSLEGTGQGSCLVRSANRYWYPEEKEEPEETLVLFRGFDSLKFSYSDAERDGPSKRQWKDEWESEKVKLKLKDSSLTYPSHLPFPYLTRVQIERGNRRQAFYFPISSSYLKAWNPYDKSFPGFPHWTPPKKDKKKDSKESGRSK